MKIAVCIGASRRGGVGVSTHLLCQGFRDEGHESDIVVTEPSVGNDHQNAVDRGWPIRPINLGLRWWRTILANTLEVLSQYDVVINNHSLEAQLVLPALPERVIRLSVVRSTDRTAVLSARPNHEYLDAVVGISPQVCRALEASGFHCQIRMIPNAVLVEPLAKPIELSQPYRLIYVGRLEDKQKNIMILPDIARALQKMSVPLTFTVVGDGRQGDMLRGRVEQLGVQQLFRFLGALPPEQAWEHLRQSHFCIVPSNFEGFGLVVAEAMGVGCVPIVSDIDVFSWILGKDCEFLQVQKNCHGDYAERVGFLIHNPDIYNTLRYRLMDRQAECFSPSRTVSQYLDLISTIATCGSRETRPSYTLRDMPLPAYYRMRCSCYWRVLQVIKAMLCVSS